MILKLKKQTQKLGLFWGKRVAGRKRRRRFVLFYGRVLAPSSGVKVCLLKFQKSKLMWNHRLQSFLTNVLNICKKVREQLVHMKAHTSVIYYTKMKFHMEFLFYEMQNVFVMGSSSVDYFFPLPLQKEILEQNVKPFL